MDKAKLLHIVLIVLLSLSVMLIGYAGFQIVYSNNAIEESIQEWDNLKALQAENTTEDSEKKEELKTSGEDKVEFNYKIPQKDILGTLIIQSTNERIPVIKGISVKDLQHGAGYFPRSALPGEEGNCVILGHRETVFNRLGKVKTQDRITLETLENKVVYHVIETKIVNTINDDLLECKDKSLLTLITCYPIQYAGPVEQRYLVIAELDRGEEDLK